MVGSLGEVLSGGTGGLLAARGDTISLLIRPARMPALGTILQYSSSSRLSPSSATESRGLVVVVGGAILMGVWLVVGVVLLGAWF